MRAQLKGAVANTRSLIAEHAAALADERTWSQNRAELRRLLRDALGAVVRIGRIIGAQTQRVLVFDRVRRTSDDELIASATAMYTTIAKDPDLFTDHGLPARVIENLQRLASALREAAAAQYRARLKHATMAKSLRMELQSGRRAIVAVEVTLADAADEHPKAVVDFRLAWTGVRAVAPREVAASRRARAARKTRGRRRLRR